ncbi:MAG: hypothetical protein F9K18_06375 [Thermoanaerobaculia bacterium]|nr:MAG: hypothetical protein F9K18_06375 [Thermoanaerobaculia bacterium]
MRAPSTLPLAIALALAAAAPLAAQPACVGLELSGVASTTVFADGFESGDATRWSEPWHPGFSTTATEDLGVTVEIGAGTPGDHLLELRWWLPGERLYQSVAVPFGAGGAAAAAERRIEGYPYPVPLRAARERERTGFGAVLAVEDRLPVAGSSIVDAGLWGEWRVEAYLDGGAEPCTPPVAFRLEP